MKKLWVLIAILASAYASAEVGGVPPRNPALAETYRVVKAASDVWEGLDNIFASLKSPPVHTGIVFVECAEKKGRVAFFNRRDGKIVMCLETVAEHNRMAGPESGGALVFILAHEFGHALIQASSVPVLGREEDAADQIAALIVKRSGAAERVIQSLVRTNMRARYSEGMASAGELYDTHSLTPQRRANVICWAGADNPALLQSAINARLLTPQRANGCARESAQAEQALAAILR